MTLSDHIPHLDLTAFREGDEAARLAFGKDLVAALRQCGFITLEGHRVDPGVIERSYASAADFFARPVEEKMQYAGGLRGYTPFGREHAKDSSVPDLKEFWQVGHSREETEGRLVWPEKPTAFQSVFEELFSALEETGRDLLSAIAMGLSLAPDYFDPRIDNGTSLLRLIHYPEIPATADPRCVRAAAHEDINLITLLVAAQGGGLEILTRDGDWLPVLNAPDHLIVDTGDMMARITNNYLPATTHRVVNPEGPNVSRYSMPFFVQPREDVMLECLPGCVAAGEKMPEPVSTGDFLNQRLVEIGLK